MPFLRLKVFPGSPHLQDVRIGVRLRLAFACLMALMFAGTSLSFWQFGEVRRSLDGVVQVERALSAVLKLHNSVLVLLNRLLRAADTRDPKSFQAEADWMVADFRSETIWIRGALAEATLADTNEERLIFNSLSTVVDTLPSRVNSLTDLTLIGDWPAVHARLANQVDRTDDVVSELVRKINSDLSERRRRLSEETQDAQRRATQILAITGIFSLALAALLGLAVTRSITRPLSALDAGARALAGGHFGQDVAISGSDELAQLAAVFNRTSRELEDLYAKTRGSEAHFRALTEKASDLILVLTRTGQIIYASPSSARVLGFAPESLADQSVRNLVETEQAADADQIFIGSDLAPGQMRSFELRFRHGDGSFRILEGVVSNLLNDPAVAGVVVNARDVSERRQAEQVLREHEQQLRQAQKMESLSVLAGGVAHDFNNLLTSVIGHTSLILDIMDPAPRIRESLEAVLESGKRAADLAQKMLAYSGKGRFVIAPVDISVAAKNVVSVVSHFVSKKITLEFHLEPDLPRIEADPGQIDQVLMNLLINAGEAIGDDYGTITVSGSMVRLDAEVLPTELLGFSINSGDYVKLEVADTGCGMTETVRSKIFDPFFSTKFTGRGLGLAAVFGIVRGHHGAIAVKSKPGLGTTFQIVFPALQTPQAPNLTELPVGPLVAAATASSKANT